MIVHIGCYTAATSGHGTGIVTVDSDPGTGAFTRIGELALTSPSWLLAHPTQPVVYATNEVDDGRITVLARTGTGELAVLDECSSGGSYPCHLAISGEYLLCSNYASGSLAVFRLGPDGRVIARTELVQHQGRGPHPSRQEGPHVHMASVRTDGLVRAVDLGIDQIVTYRLQADGRLSQVDVLRLPAGFGPRQIADLPDGRSVVLGELASAVALTNGSSVTSVVAATATGARADNLPAQLNVAADGRTLYVSNRGADCITTLRVDGTQLRLGADVAVGRGPRHFAIADGRAYVAAQDGDRVEVHAVDADGFGPPMAGYPTGTPTFVLLD